MPKLLNRPVIYLLLIVSVSGLWAPLIRHVGQRLPSFRVNAWLIAHAAPKQLQLNDWYASFAGFHVANAGSYRTQLRICSFQGDCWIEWPRRLEAEHDNEDVWSMTGNRYRLAQSGPHRFTMFLQRYWADGYRSIGRYSWSAHVE